MSTTNTHCANTASPAATCVDHDLAEQHLRAVYGRAADGDGRIVIYSKRPFAVAFFPPVALDAASGQVALACEFSFGRRLESAVSGREKGR